MSRPQPELVTLDRAVQYPTRGSESAGVDDCLTGNSSTDDALAQHLQVTDVGHEINGALRVEPLTDPQGTSSLQASMELDHTASESLATGRALQNHLTSTVDVSGEHPAPFVGNHELVAEQAADPLSEHLLRLISSRRKTMLGETKPPTFLSERSRWEKIVASNHRIAKRATAMERSPAYADHGLTTIKGLPDAQTRRIDELGRHAIWRKLIKHAQRKHNSMTSKISGLRRSYRSYNRQWRAHCERLDRIGEGRDGVRRIVSFAGSGPGTPMHAQSFLQSERSGEDGERSEAVNVVRSARTILADSRSASTLLEDVSEGQQQQQQNHTSNFHQTSSTMTYTAIPSDLSTQNNHAAASFDEPPSAGGLLASATAAAMTRANRRNTQGSGGLVGFGDAVRSEAEFLEILATLESADMQDPSMRAARTTAVEPDMMLSTVDMPSGVGIGGRQKQGSQDFSGRGIEYVRSLPDGSIQDGGHHHASDLYRQCKSAFLGRTQLKRSYDDDNGFVADPSTFYLSDFDPDVWSDDEKAIFARRYALFPKQFGKIASSLPNKTARQCVSYYYLTKKLYGHDYKTLLASRNRDRRRKTKLVKPKKGRGSALMADLKAATPADEDASAGAGEDTTDAPSEKPRGRFGGGGEEEASETLAEKPRIRQSTSSYWSVAERNDFLRSLAVFGKDWEAIALTLSSKSAAQARNFYSRNARDPDFSDAVEMARKNEGRSLNERREAAEILLQRSTNVDDQRRAEHHQKARDRPLSEGRGPMVDIIQAASTGASGGGGEVMRGLDISSLLNADPDSNSGNNSMRRASKQVYWFDRFLSFDHQRAPTNFVSEEQRPSSSSSAPPSFLPPSSSHRYQL